MPLRRVTLSGRFAQFESQSKEPTIAVVVKGLCAVAVDVAIAFIVTAYAFFLFKGKLIAPYERGFYCYEIPGLSEPFVPNTVSTRHLLTVSLALPFFVIGLTEAFVFITSEGTNRLRKYFHSATSIYLEYLASFTVALFAMEALKCWVGRLRPHYLSVCKPDWGKINCSDPHNYVESANCLGTDMHRLRIGRQSFPSGHSTAAVLLFLFLYYYLRGIVCATGNKLLGKIRYALLFVVLLWAALVMTTRVTDGWHHPSDVLGGALLALICAYIPIRRADSSLVYRKRMLENSHNS